MFLFAVALVPALVAAEARAQQQPPVRIPALAAPMSDSATGRPITLSEAIATAQRNAPSAIQAQGQVRAGATSVRAARAAFIPNVNLSTGLTRQNNVATRVNPTTGELSSNRYQSTTSLSASLDLFDGFRRINDLKAARAQENAAETGVSATNANLAFSVKQQYYAALAARESEVAAQAQLAQAEQQLALSIAKLHALTATRSDSLRGVIAVSQAQLALLQARNNRATADAALTRVIGSDVPVSATPTGLTADTAFVALDSAQLAALAQDNPNIRSAQASLEAARFSYRSARGAYYPTVSLSYGRNLSSSNNSFDPFGSDYTTSGNFRLNVGLPLYNQFNRERTIINAGIAASNAEASLRDQQLLAQQSLVQAITALRTAQQQIVLQQQSVAAAEEDLRVQQERYQLGVSTLLDVLTSQTQLNNARLALVQARFSARTARAQLEQLVGRDL
ncbi:outer membrane efflux protein [Gemmatirosa kalamazoonensis]|uniref:Outer membrane efflux protein n=1 Tax=Gemmatirosa kalamazoonensis TaxID=861299 RepID=W0RGR0_9BACT|nr:outer membrane efflux protein [Gemmatirosa kalamazoonensis]